MHGPNVDDAVQIFKRHTDRQVIAAIAVADGASVAQAWFQGLNPQLDDRSRPLAGAIRPRLTASQVQDAIRLVIEDRSSDTYENARFTEELVRPRVGSRCANTRAHGT